ncbi:bifunctional Creatinase-aminopeptidase-like/Peptidase M24A [Babesia duncani]|uniref:Bifunctional Creatinase-aminopeptidase-like/Peptidase M24A n=1 Tax=Babesia duncani TaxID=323732 RepID=A0AAD9PJV5_9APIC|nr:bifunctional Creatinase-aminopeptidase-like/Peptidase M24A [Babesia duncani]
MGQRSCYTSFLVIAEIVFVVLLVSSKNASFCFVLNSQSLLTSPIFSAGGPKGFQELNPPKPHASNHSINQQRQLKSRFPDASISDVWRNYKYTGRLKKGVLSGQLYPSKWCQRPNYYRNGNPTYVNYPRANDYRDETDPRGTIKTPQEITKIRRACRLAREILDSVAPYIVEGYFTDDIDRCIHEQCRIRNVYPSTLHYHGYPKSCCTSINEVACHGIPDSTVLAAGDLINVDFTAYFDGYHGDVSETFMVLPQKEKPTQKKKCTTHGMYERNKLTYYAKTHDNVYDSGMTIIHQLFILKQFNCGLKRLKRGDGWQELHRRMNDFICDNNAPSFGLKECPSTQKLREIGQKLLRDINKYVKGYSDEIDDYNGPILGVENDTVPNFVKVAQTGIMAMFTSPNEEKEVYFDLEQPSQLFPVFLKKDPDRYHKVHLFSHTYERDIKLAKAAHDATMEAIKICRPGVRLSEIGRVISEVAESRGFYSFPNLVGHGIGKNFHEFPNINHVRNDDDITMETGMVFTIEPILGTSDCKEFCMWPDGWTIVTPDGSKSAQFEHTIVITETGHEILTRRLDSSPLLCWENPIEVRFM